MYVPQYIELLCKKAVAELKKLFSDGVAVIQQDLVL